MISIGKDKVAPKAKEDQPSLSRQSHERRARKSAAKKMNNDKIFRLQKAGIVK
jgi:hypothetical protein